VTTDASAKKMCAKCGASEWGSRNRCKPCRAREEHVRLGKDPEAQRAKSRLWRRSWRRAHPDEEAAASRRRRYGLSATELAKMIRAQGGVCRICERPRPNCVDHDHETGRIRGVLCATCNAGLGHFRDDVERMRAAAAYLSRT